LIPKTKGSSNKSPQENHLGTKTIQYKVVVYADLPHGEGWIIPSLISISGYAGGWQSIHILLANQKKD
jgi:hypothetical protein